MEITLKRVYANKDETLGLFFVEGDLTCFGLEDEYRVEKVNNETRIPKGRYQIKLRTSGSIHPKYKARFPDFHQGMLWLQDVPGFDWIYIHMGNKDEHSAGCLLVAEQARIDQNATLTTPNSAPGYERLYKRVVDAAGMGELWITIFDEGAL